MLDFAIATGLAATTVGVMEYLKGFIPAKMRAKVPSWVYRLTLAGAAVGVSWGQPVPEILLVLSLAQIGYEAFVKFLKSKVAGSGQ